MSIPHLSLALALTRVGSDSYSRVVVELVCVVLDRIPDDAIVF
jgi:hypothetical protein